MVQFMIIIVITVFSRTVQKKDARGGSAKCVGAQTSANSDARNAIAMVIMDCVNGDI